jgi:2-polyprenyl-3-methyl-5-hydroxy-6-metoxy-1,4-benzoquinol methylase
MNEKMNRGGNSKLEINHAKELIKAGVEGVWRWNSPAGHERVKARVQWLIEMCNLRRGLNVLECGCGTGIFTRHIAKTGANITAVDISAELLEVARSRCTSEVNFIQADLENPKELPDNYYDVLCGVSVLHHLSLPLALSELKKKLKQGACFAFSEPNLLNPINKYVMFTDDMEKRKRLGTSSGEMAFKPDELVSLFQESGYEVISLKHRDFLHPSVPQSLIPLIKRVQFIAERTPLVRSWSGSLWITGIKK